MPPPLSQPAPQLLHSQVRYLIYAKGLESAIDIASPADLGGLKGDAFLALNPQGKMPVLVLPDGTAIPESDTMARYVLDAWAGTGPSFDPGTPVLRAKSNLAARLLDTYISPIQGCLYKAMAAGERAAQLAELARQLTVLEGVVAGPRVCGSAPSLADSALFPTLVFAVDILPTVYGWDDVFASRPKLGAHFAAMAADPAGARVVQEMRCGLQSWIDGDRWGELGIRAQVAADPAAFKH